MKAVFVSKALNVNEKGNLTIGGCDVVELANTYGTPLYVMDETLIRQNCKEYKEALEACYDGNGMVLYAGKAFSSRAICKIVAEEGLGLDVVSGGELYTAMQAGFPADRIYFHGNYKSEAEIRMGISYGIRSFAVDNAYELNMIQKIGAELGKVVEISMRLKPGIDAHTHDFIMTGQIDSKFGVAIENGEAMALVKEALAMPNVSLRGIHCHIGSQIFDYAPFEAASVVMLEFVNQIKQETGYEITELNLGGGYGIPYLEEHDPVPFGAYIKAISAKVKAYCAEHNLKVPYILMEPGRSIVASAGITLYTVGCVKDIKNVRKYVLVDGSMADNPRYALYGAEYECLIANRPTAEKTEVVTIGGRTCESGDILIKDYKMPEVQSGDILAVLATGAYNYSMSSNYNRLPRPAVVLTKEGTSRVIVKAETYEDVIRNDVE